MHQFPECFSQFVAVGLAVAKFIEAADHVQVGLAHLPDLMRLLKGLVDLA